MNKLVLLIILLLSGYLVKSQNNQLFEENSKVTKVGSGYAFTEGPSVAPDVRIFFTDQPNDKIYIWHEKGNVITIFYNTANGQTEPISTKKANWLPVPICITALRRSTKKVK